jgi:uncharacterized protein YndB with AHSA1/START domain
VPSQETEAAVEVEVLIDASPETVFEFFTDAEKMILWMGRTAELEARPGGAFRCDMNGRDVALGEFVEVDPPRRAVFTWGWEGEGVAVEPGASTVEILLAPEGDGTRLRLAHRDLPSPESAARHRGGWEHFTTRLAVAASGGDPGADPWATAT